MIKRTKFKRQDEQGYLIILSLIIVFALMSIGISMAGVLSTQYATTKQNTYVENAISTAEAGISATVAQLNTSSTFAGYDDGTNRQVLYDNPQRGKAEYSTTIATNADGTKTVTSKSYVYAPGGTTAADTKTIRAIVKSSGVSVPASVVAGPGGILASQGPIGGKNIYVNGQVNMTGGDLGVGNHPFGATTTSEVDVANVGCGTAANYPQPCGAGNEPIKLTSFNSDVWGSRVCATNQVTSAQGPFSIITGLQPNCTAPQVTMPAYDRGGLYNAMLAANGTKPASTIGACSIFTTNNLTIAKDTIYTGNYSVSGSGCVATIKGNAYFTGNFGTTFFGSLKVDDALTTPPFILVDGTINLAGTSVIRNSSGVGAVFISFKSANATCNVTPSCVSLSSADLYNSVNTTTVTVEAKAYGSTVYSYFGTAKTAVAGTVSGMAGQRIWADALSAVAFDVPTGLTHNVNATGLANDDAFGGRTEIRKWKVAEYQQIYP